MRVEAHEVHAALCDDATPWVMPLPGALPPPPQDFVDLGRRSPTDRTFAAEHYVDVIVEAPRKYRRVVSGGKCLRLRSLRAEQFIKALFHHIADHSPVKVTLAPFDLSHGHMVACLDASGAPVDFAIVFHAKEYPREYRHTQHGEVLPEGHPDMGGDEDPRIGSDHSTTDANYHMRNYVYLMSLNRVVLIDAAARHAGGMLGAIVGSDEFSTLAERCLGTVVGDVNYFVDGGVLVSPRHGWDVGLLLGNAVHALRGAVAAAPAQALLGVADADAPLVEAMRDEVGVHGISVVGAIDAVRAVLRRASAADLQALSSPASLHTVPMACSEVIAEWAAIAVREKEEDARRRNAQHRQELLDKGVDPGHADTALQHTASGGVFSAYRALHLLEVTHPEYRSPANTRAFGDKRFAFDTAKEAWSHAFYADSALEALDLHESMSALCIREACARVVARKDEQTRHEILQRQQQCPRQRDRKQSLLSELREKYRPHL